VNCRPLDDFFERFGVPYYLKVDIEGHDDCCIQAVERASELPRYVSTEATVTDFGRRMSAIGYDGFKMVSQLWHQCLPCPRPPREGSFVEARFTNHCSGPFGEETYGPWLSLEEFTREHDLCTRREYEGSLHERLGCPRELFLDSWFDFHARLG
jgi:hypothetical protein